MKASKEQVRPKPAHGISVWLDSYDDIFSDFDSRAYEHRALSDDFLSELKKLSREDERETGEFHLLLPAALRNEETERIIERRLRQYFKKTQQEIMDQISGKRRKAILFALLGLLLLLAGGYISFLKPVHLAWHLLMITCEPAGWFLVWMSYDLFASNRAGRKSELNFYSGMMHSGISFRSS